MNLETRFDSDLRDRPVNPDDVRTKVAELEMRLSGEVDPVARIRLFGQIGSFHRILNALERAEENFKRAVELSTSLQISDLRLVNLIRLGHTRHWMGKFEEAHRIFGECFRSASGNRSAARYLDFIHQHEGKCCFDEGRYEVAMKHFYEALLLRNKKADLDLTDSSLFAIEETKRRWLAQLGAEEVLAVLSIPSMPAYMKSVHGKRHGNELPSARLNCIDAALAFHGLKRDRQSPADPMELLNFLSRDTDQLRCPSEFEVGDLVVWWNRSGGSWDERRILISEMNPRDTDFPYGLIFDHVAVRVTPEIVFNKPNPSPRSEYRLDFLETASYPSRLGKGYEMTFHRVRAQI